MGVYQDLQRARIDKMMRDYEGDTQRHAMEMDRLDRANAMAQYDKLFGYATGGGVGGGAGGYLNAEDRLRSLLDDPESLRQTGSYKFRVKQGQDALERSLGARGMLGSGNRLMELTKYGQDMASQEYENQFGRLKSLLDLSSNERSNMFGSLAGALSGGALGGGGTGSIWSAYSAPRVAAIQGNYEQNRPKSWQRTAFGYAYQ